MRAGRKKNAATVEDSIPIPDDRGHVKVVDYPVRFVLAAGTVASVTLREQRKKFLTNCVPLWDAVQNLQVPIEFMCRNWSWLVVGSEATYLYVHEVVLVHVRIDWW